MDTKNNTSKDDFNATSHKTDVICRSFKISRNDFFENFIKDVKILIKNREECYEFQRIAFEFGVKVHSDMKNEKQEPILYNICDKYPHYKGKTFDKDMHNLVIYDEGTRLQQSAFYELEKDKKEIKFCDFISAYNSIE